MVTRPGLLEGSSESSGADQIWRAVLMKVHLIRFALSPAESATLLIRLL